MRHLITAILFALPLHAESPSEHDFKAARAKLDAKSSKEDRIAAIKWIADKSESEYAALAIEPLEKLIRSNGEEEVRRAAMTARQQIARNRNEPCPLAIVEALRDPVDMVRYEASMWAGLFKTRYAEGSVKLLIEALGDKRAEVRSDCLSHLADAGGKDSKALQAIENAKKDKVFNVRHSAFVAHFRLTNNLADYLDYLVRLSEDPVPLLDLFPADSQEANVQQTLRNLIVIGSAIAVAGWSENQPEELAKCLVKLLDHKSAAIRRGAARLLGAAAHRVELTQSKAPGQFELIFPHLDSGELGKLHAPGVKLPTAKKEKPRPPLPSKAYAKFLEFKADRLLRYLSTMDEDLTVRATASLSLKRFAELPEPLTVAPRVVNPEQ